MKYYLSILLGTIAGIALGYSHNTLQQYVSKASRPSIQQKAADVKRFSAPTFIDSIQPPTGYTMVREKDNPFGKWLLRLPLRKDNKVYLYNGRPKQNQSLHYAVLDVPYNHNALQQCADAVMRLRAEYIYATKVEPNIRFYHQKGEYFSCPVYCSRPQLESFLNNVFSWCGTYSLQAGLQPVQNMQAIKAGDVFVKGGSPGHAMLVAAVAKNAEGKKVFLLLQSFIPAQDIHIVINPYNDSLSPWYNVDAQVIATPGWPFKPADLRRW